VAARAASRSVVRAAQRLMSKFRTA
jgi:hypothetical protein